MKKIVFFILILSFTGALFFVSCKREKSCESCKAGNKSPIAIAGPDQIITLPTDSVSLDGSASSDPDGTITGFQWRKITGTGSYLFTDSSVAKTNVKHLSAGSYQFEVKVTDNGGLTAKDTLQIVVDSSVATNHPPVADAGPDQIIMLPESTALLDGKASTDPDNNLTGYQWSKITGPFSFNITRDNNVQTQATNLIEGVYQFELKVTDAGGLFSKDTIQITVKAVTANNCDISARPFIDAQLTLVGTLSEAREEPAVAAAGSKIVFAGGLKNWNCDIGSGTASAAVDIFDRNNNTWTTAQLSIPRWGMGVTACGNKIFFAGGENGQWTAYDNIDIYDASANTWSVAHLSEPRAFLAAATIGNKVFFAGGYNYPVPVTASSKVDIYDLSSNTWSTASLPVPQSNFHSVTSGNEIYFTGSELTSNLIEIYNTSANSFTTSTLQYLHKAFSGLAVNNTVYWSGEAQVGQVLAGKVEIRNITNGTTAVECLSDLRQWEVLRNNEIAFLSPGNQFDSYNTITGQWSIGKIKQIPIASGAGVISVNNKIYVAGGRVSGCNVYTDKVYILSW